MALSIDRNENSVSAETEFQSFIDLVTVPCEFHSLPGQTNLVACNDLQIYHHGAPKTQAR